LINKEQMRLVLKLRRSEIFVTLHIAKWNAGSQIISKIGFGGILVSEAQKS
jgi:lauroyl/myristoyl acyltransferase